MTPPAPRAQSLWIWRSLLAAAALALIAIYLLGTGAALSNYDEPIYAEFIRAMHESGDYLSLRYQGAETLQRPPFGVALYAGLATIGDGEWAMRLGPALSSTIAAILVGVFAGRTTGSRAAGLVAAAVTAGAPTFYVYGRLLLSDPPFVLATAGALIATMAAQTNPRAMRWIAICLGMAFLLKSMAAAVPTLLLAPWWLLAAKRHHLNSRVGARRILTDLAIFATLALSYYVIGFAMHGERFWDEHIGAMLLDRASGELSPLIGIGGPDAYLRHMASHDGALYCLIAAASVIATAAIAWRERNPALGVLATYALGSLLLLSLISTRLPHYLLALYPAIGLCAAMTAHHIACKAGEQRRMVTTLVCATAIALFGQGIAASPGDVATLPNPICKELGAVAAEQPGDARVYSLDWYAPAFGFYSEKPWTMLHSNAQVAAQLAAMDPFAQAKNVLPAEPWPEGRFLLAAHESSLQASGLEVHKLLASSRGFVLTWVSAAKSRPAIPSRGS
ncbi:MAG: phospholipid carrier-dependent glycosyltransferase [Myxococcales bacterium]|nr:phospholipid carrier-dependent glycosyltransferase [Myxococcales bacterium]